MSCPLHRLVSLVGTISPDGSASPFDTLVKLAEITKAQHFPMPLPLYVSSAGGARPARSRSSRSGASAPSPAKPISGSWASARSARTPYCYRDGFMNRSELLEHGPRTAPSARSPAGSSMPKAASSIAGTEPARDQRAAGTRQRPACASASVRAPAKVVHPLRAALDRQASSTASITDEDTARALLAD